MTRQLLSGCTAMKNVKSGSRCCLTAAQAAAHGTSVKFDLASARQRLTPCAGRAQNSATVFAGLGVTPTFADFSGRRHLSEVKPLRPSARHLQEGGVQVR